MAMEHLAYISRAAQLSERDLACILAQSRRNNPQHRISGYLQCRGGYFFQILEGPRASLDALLARLRRDPRHADLKLLFREPVTRREFANWSMGFMPGRAGQAGDYWVAPLQHLHEAGPVSAARVLGVFYSLMDAPG